jgi:hypothetical protein
MIKKAGSTTPAFHFIYRFLANVFYFQFCLLKICPARDDARFSSRRSPGPRGTPAHPEEDIVEDVAASDDFTEALLVPKFLAQDDVLFFQLKLHPLGIGGHITNFDSAAKPHIFGD